MFDRERVFLGIAPAGWTNDDMPELGAANTFEQCVSEMALAGFAGTEIGYRYPTDAEALHQKLAVRGLRVASGRFDSSLIAKSLEENLRAFEAQLDLLAALGATCVHVSERGPGVHDTQNASTFGGRHIMDDDQFRQLADGLNALGAAANRRGFRLSFQHRIGAAVQTAEETTRLMDETDDRFVFLCCDTGHLLATGADPVTLLRRFASRVGYVRLKDVRIAALEQARRERWSFLTAVRNGVFTVPGDGDFDFAPVFDTLDRAGYEGWLLVEAEQDPAKANPFEYASKARRYIRERTGL